MNTLLDSVPLYNGLNTQNTHVSIVLGHQKLTKLMSQNELHAIKDLTSLHREWSGSGC